MLSKIKMVLLTALASSGLFLFAAPVSTLALAPGVSGSSGSSSSTSSGGSTDCSNPATIQEQIQCGANGGSGQKNPDASKASSKLDDIISTTVNILTIIVGVVAVIMIIIAGLRYVASGGDANKVSSAKNTLLYAIIGLVVVALAQIIVRFVLNKTTT